MGRIIVALLCAAVWARGQEAVGQEEYARKVQSLEQRVAQLEAMVRELMAERTGGSAAVAAATPAPAAAAAVSAAPASPVPEGARSFEMPPELLPSIGKIGAEAGLIFSGALNPYHLNAGGFAAGFIDLPLFDRPSWMHGKVSYEILIGLSNSTTTFATTSNVAQVSNLAVLTAIEPGRAQNVGDALSGTGAAPFPVTTSTRTALSLLEVVPFSLKYTSTALDRWRVRPYAVLGWGTYVTIHEQNPAGGNPPGYGIRTDANLPPAALQALESLYGGRAPFGSPLVAGQIGQSPELEARGLPSGHGNIDFGLASGAGFEFRLSRTLSLGFDARFNRIAGAPGLLTTYGTRLGFHF